MSIGSLFSRHARYRPNHLAVVFEDQRLTWFEYNQSINRLANVFLGMGIKKEDKIATLLPNCLELLEVYWAAAKIGAVVVPLSTLLLEKAMQNLLQDSDAVMLVTDAGFVESVDAIKPGLTHIPADRFLRHDKWGETPVAAVILQPGKSTAPDVLVKWINERVGAKFQRLSSVMIMDEFPRSVAGKTLKRVMRESFWKGEERNL